MVSLSQSGATWVPRTSQTQQLLTHIYSFFKTQVTAAVSDTHLEKAKKNISTAKCFFVATLIVLPVLSPVVGYLVYLVGVAVLFLASFAPR